jgi:CRISPR-associated protein Cas5d
MSFGVKVEVWGDYALFSRPEMKTERVSYDMMTPSAARGILEAIYWHPGLMWNIGKIHVCREIKFANIRRNEVKSKISANKMRMAMNGSQEELYLVTANDIQQRASMILKDVRYVIEAHFELTEKANESDNEGKFCDIFKRRLQKGQFYHQPYFGCREFPANFKPFEEDKVSTVYENEEKDLGYMLYDMDYTDKNNIMPLFFGRY